jgi:hypothetical protein
MKTTNLYVTQDGRVVTGTYKAIAKRFNIKTYKFNWTYMHSLNSTYGLTKQEKLFFESIGFPPTIFNVANLREFGLFHVYPIPLSESKLKDKKIEVIENDFRN